MKDQPGLLGGRRAPLAITGMGLVSAAGRGIDRFTESLRRGRSHLAPLTRLGCHPSPQRMGGEIRLRGFGGRDGGWRWPHTIASMAIDEALAASRGRKAEISLDKTGVALGTALGPVEEIDAWVDAAEPLSAKWLGGMSFEAFAARLSRFGEGGNLDRRRLGGPRSVFSATCVSGLCALEQAASDLALGRAESMVVGAVDTLSGFMYQGFSALQALSPSGGLRPFGVDHDGIVIGEAACFLVIEPLAAAKAREASVPACLLAQRLMSDCYHLTSADPGGKAMARAIASTLADAGLAAEDIGCLTLTATGSPLYDRMLSLAVEEALGEAALTIPATTFEPAVGHVLAATGTLALAHAAILIRERTIFPAFDVCQVDPHCRLSYVLGDSIRLSSPAVLSLVVGFGGQNGVSLVVGPELAARAFEARGY